jgi:hypothetical protein
MRVLIASANVLSLGLIVSGEVVGLFIGITAILMTTTAVLVLIDNEK